MSDKSSERTDLLADVAEMYFLEGKNQAQIAKSVGVTRSMVSRMLTQARQMGIVEIRIHRPLRSERELELALCQRFGLHNAFVLARRHEDTGHPLQELGAAGAHVLKNLLSPGTILGLAWGTAIHATVQALEVEDPIPIKVVQLVGALGARNKEYDAHALVQRLAQAVGGEGFYLNAPFFLQNQETVQALLANRSVSETVTLGKQCHVALLGIGSTDPGYSSFYIAGYAAIDDLNALHEAGAVGDVCGCHYDIDGNLLDVEFHRRIIAIKAADLLGIPVRLGVAGGLGKVRTILGALRGGYINVLVTDSIAAREVLRQQAQDGR